MVGARSGPAAPKHCLHTICLVYTSVLSVLIFLNKLD